ncbi:unnamed protein product [Clavelina lepadiformis]|uniref:Uncharacterized protein n=1 Tax=Clavelina lepadiformis TaxID=159417 RepID=A0ABP0G5Y4_CLALP
MTCPDHIVLHILTQDGLLQYLPELNSRAVFCLPEFLEQPGCRCLAALRVLKAGLFPAENLGATSCPPKLCSGEASFPPKLQTINRTETETKPLPTEIQSRFFSAGFPKLPHCCWSTRAVSLPSEFQRRGVAAGIREPPPCRQSCRAILLPPETWKRLVVAGFPERFPFSRRIPAVSSPFCALE